MSKKVETRGAKRITIEPVERGCGLWVEVGEASDIAGLNPRTIKRLAKDKKIKTDKRGVRTYYYMKKKE